MAAGEMIDAIAMTEPGAGSDLQGIRTTAVRDGDDYVLNGAKISSPTARTATSSSSSPARRRAAGRRG